MNEYAIRKEAGAEQRDERASKRYTSGKRERERLDFSLILLIFVEHSQMK